tara:strand:- start:42 stop:506 length:465 start_codon:yes stop_codon:yes gene_type:complete
MDWLNKRVEESPYKLAMIGGIVISIIATTFMAGIQSWFPESGTEGLEAVDRLLSGDLAPAFILFFAIAIVSPILEELIFRKFLWWISSFLFEQVETLFIISILFVMLHGSLFLAIGLLPISFFVGWLRMKTGSIKHSIVAHAANNIAATLFFLL